MHLGRRAIDFVGQEDAGDDRPGAHVEGAGGGPVDLGAGQIGGEQVGRELDAAKREVERLGQGADGPGLGQAGHALDEHVTAGQECDHQPFQKHPLTDDEGFHALDEPGKALGSLGVRGRGLLGNLEGRVVAVAGHERQGSPWPENGGRGKIAR